MAIHTFIVGYARDKDALRAGEVISGRRVVVVDADGPVEARLIAEQMIAAIGFEPTEVDEVKA